MLELNIKAKAPESLKVKPPILKQLPDFLLEVGKVYVSRTARMTLPIEAFGALYCGKFADQKVSTIWVWRKDGRFLGTKVDEKLNNVLPYGPQARDLMAPLNVDLPLYEGQPWGIGIATAWMEGAVIEYSVNGQWFTFPKYLTKSMLGVMWTIEKANAFFTLNPNHEVRIKK